jgi:catalase
MTAQQAEEFRYNVLDLTKVWPHSQFPLRPVGKIVLNENVQTYFAEIEQVAFSPSHLVPGIEPSADAVLQSRLFSYPDTHRHRLGTNYQQLPVNAPIVPIANFQRDGAMAFNNQGPRPNYQSSIVPLSFRGRPYEAADERHETWIGLARYDLSEINELDFEQPRALYQKVMDQTAKEHLVNNVVGHLGNVKSAEVKARQCAPSVYCVCLS